ncbi:MAG: diguanylate cyclase [Chloroflexi bacterium]|nr:diguanylate cyclase [Chloroflexota bacterium]
MEIKLYLRMLQKGWWIILLAMLVAVASSLTVSYLTTPRYSATARFIITPSPTLKTSVEVINSLNTLDRASVVATYVEVMNSDKILADSLKFLNVSADSLKDYTVNAVALPSSSVLELTVTGPDPKLVADLSNAIGQQTIIFSNSINFILAINFLDMAAPSPIPLSPQPLRDAGLALVIGLVTGALFAVLSEQIRIPFEVYRQRLNIDNMTGVYNSRYFRRLIEDMIAEEPDKNFSMGLVEINGLRDLLESLPPSGLQQIFKNVTDTLRNELRGNDVVARWDDVSFSILLPETPGSAALKTFDRIFQALSAPIDLPQFDLNIKLDPHIGGVVYSNRIASQELFTKANDSLDEARRSNARPVYLWEMKTPFWPNKETN